MERQNERVMLQSSRLGWERRIAEIEKERNVERTTHGAETTLLRQRLDYQRRAVESRVREMINRNSLLHEVASDVKRLEPYVRGEGADALERLTARLRRTIEAIRKEGDSGIRWDDHMDFMNMMSERYPTLSPMEKKVAALIRLNVTSGDIAESLFLSKRTVEYHRMNIRKKIGLDRSTDLTIALFDIS